MKTYNFDKPLLDLDEKPVENTNLGKLLAGRIATSEANTRSIKWVDWAKSLHRTGLVMLDDTDALEFKAWIGGEKTGMTMLLVSALLMVFNEGVDFVPSKAEKI